MNAIWYAVLLANHFYEIKTSSFENFKLAQNECKEKRFEAIEDQYPPSHISAKLILEHVSKLENRTSQEGQRTTEVRFVFVNLHFWLWPNKLSGADH